MVSVLVAINGEPTLHVESFTFTTKKFNPVSDNEGNHEMHPTTESVPTFV